MPLLQQDRRRGSRSPGGWPQLSGPTWHVFQNGSHLTVIADRVEESERQPVAGMHTCLGPLVDIESAGPGSSWVRDHIAHLDDDAQRVEGRRCRLRLPCRLGRCSRGKPVSYRDEALEVWAHRRIDLEVVQQQTQLILGRRNVLPLAARVCLALLDKAVVGEQLKR